jgi:hypothetical protein
MPERWQKVVLGILGAVPLFLFGTGDSLADRVVNANEPIVILDDINKRSTTVESTSFPATPTAPAAIPNLRYDDLPPPSFPDEPRVQEDDRWPSIPGTSESPTMQPSTPQTRHPASQAPAGEPLPSIPRSAAGNPTPTSDPGAAGSDESPGTGARRFRRPGTRTGRVSVTTGDGSVGSAAIPGSDPNAPVLDLTVEP